MAASSSHRSGPAPAPEHGQLSSSNCVDEESDIDADLLEVPQPQPLISAISIEGRVAALRAVALRDSPVDAWMLRFLYAQRKEELDLFRKHLLSASGTPAFQAAIASVISANRGLLADLGIEQPQVAPQTRVRRSALRRTPGDVPPPRRQ